MKEWNELSISEKVPYLKLGLDNGIIDIDTISNTYNSYARGGYTKWKEKLKYYRNIDADNDDTYDYQSYFISNPKEAWNIIKGKGHFPDTWKTVKHPTFSNESAYSGYKNKYNPTGIVGGTWQNNEYYLSKSQEANNWNTDRTIDYLGLAGNSTNLHASDGSSILRSVTIKPTIREIALAKSRTILEPNTNFMNAQDMSQLQRLRATYLQGIPNNIMKHPHTCINTVTGFYDSNNTVAKNTSIWKDPTKYGYQQIPQTEAQAGDLIILSNSNNHPVHAVMFDGVASKDSNYNGYPYNAGDTLVNYSNGGLNKEDYRLQAPLKRFDDRESAGGDFSGQRRYYKYIEK